MEPLQVRSRCPTCNGRGTIIERPCTTCKGEGKVRAQKTTEVQIPAGISEEFRLRVARQVFNPQPSTLNPQPSTLNHKTLDPKPDGLRPQR
jgi:molecular chaperone DnaJ